LFVTVNVKGALATPTGWAAKLNCGGFTPMLANPCAVPLRGTVTAFTPFVAEVMERIATAASALAGAKTRSAVQPAPAASTAPQVVVATEKLLAKVPVIWKPTLAIESSPLLVTVRVKGALATPTGDAAKLRLGGKTAKAGGSRPRPLRETVMAFTPRVEDEIVSVAAAPPDADGLKTT